MTDYVPGDVREFGGVKCMLQRVESWLGREMTHTVRIWKAVTE